MHIMQSINIINLNRSKAAVLLFALVLTSTSVFSQSQILTIGGDVYGGGREGAVGTTNTEATDATEKTDVTLNAAPTDVTSVTINSGTIRTVFGGGENGRVYGKTNVTITGSGTQIGGDIDGKDWTGTIHGGVFGAGDGSMAYVFGGSNVTVTNGTVKQNVYGGGNQADLIGSTKVWLKGGDFQGNVFGGARMANIYGHAYVLIDGAHAQNDLIINGVYGGNDISGTAQSSDTWSWVSSLTAPFAPEETISGIDDYNAFVQATATEEGKTADGKSVFVGQVYGGGNGDYTYDETGGASNLTVELDNGETDDPATTDVDESKTTFNGLSLPTVDKVYLELASGTYGYVYGGGNNATVVESTDICINNADDITKAGGANSTDAPDSKVLDERLAAMGINLTTFNNANQFIRVFGGNNQAEMSIRPSWHLLQGTIDNLYSGGNAGNMTYPDGLILAVTEAGMTVNNVYGGCRKADVRPKSSGTDVTTIDEETKYGYTFPKNYAARVLIKDGTVTNVYGGNDVSGDVYVGTDVEIQHSILGDVYGGGNGSYAYTDNVTLKDQDSDQYGDFYYAVDFDGLTTDDAKSLKSAQALSHHRPNVEKVLVHVKGTAENTTYVGGGVYCGGNSATLRERGVSGTLENADEAQLQFGSYVVANKMFLGSNGEDMKDPDKLSLYNGNVTVKGTTYDFSKMDLTKSETFEEYMKGVEVAIKPVVSFDASYDAANPAKVGSLFCGGNVGSMSASGYFGVDFLNKIIIFDKLVGGCNDANIPAGTYNAFHQGGLIGNHDDNGTKVTITIDGLKFEPRILERSGNSFTFTNWNVADGYLQHGNIYGGCYSSGYINGGVQIIIKDDVISSEVASALTSIGSTEANHRDYVFSTALSAFGGGYGSDTEIWGDTEIKLSDNAKIWKVFGGGEMGVVGKLERDTDGEFTGNVTDSYNTKINLTGGNVGKIYGGGFEGLVTGSTTVNLGTGTVYDVIGGACNADIDGYAETYIGVNGFPTVTNNVYGANDFGGTISGTHTFTGSDKTYNNDLLTASAYVKYNQGIVNYIFGGAKASYHYSEAPYSTKNSTPFVGSTFVNFSPLTSFNQNSAVARVYGAGEGVIEVSEVGLNQDTYQDRSYVLIDIPKNNGEHPTNFQKMLVFGSGDASGLGMRTLLADDDTETHTGSVTSSAVVDLVNGLVDQVFGGSNKTGLTRRTIVNVPTGSTISLNKIFGGAFGTANTNICDVYESNVNYNSGVARVSAIYGGNSSFRRTLYTHVNIGASVIQPNGWYATVYGAGWGADTWAQYTEVNLNDGACVYEVYGGGENGMVLNKETVNGSATGSDGWAGVNGYPTELGSLYTDNGLESDLAKVSDLKTDLDVDGDNNGKYNTNVHINEGATVNNYCYGAGLGSHIYAYRCEEDYNEFEVGTTITASDYAALPAANQSNWESVSIYRCTEAYDEYTVGTTITAAEYAELTTEDQSNWESVTIYRCTTAYGEETAAGTIIDGNGYKSLSEAQKLHWVLLSHYTTATTSGTSYIDLLGGTVTKDLYAAGTTGYVKSLQHEVSGIPDFTASATAYIKGGVVRSVYGGGWEGPVGYHDITTTATDTDIPGATYVYIGKSGNPTDNGYTLLDGVPAVRVNAYGGGEGGPVFGTANLTLNNGYIGFAFKDGVATDAAYSADNYEEYVDELTVDSEGNPKVNKDQWILSGNIYGGGYVDDSNVDESNITIYNGAVRNSVYGGGEIGTVGRGNTSGTLYKAGGTNITMYGGEVRHDIFGGGRGFNYRNESGSLGTAGYVFGTTDVRIHGGHVGTRTGVQDGYGNVFGGGNVGFVYGNSFKHSDGRYYTGTAKTALTIDGKTFAVNDPIPTYYLTKLSETSGGISDTDVELTLSEDTHVEVKVYGKATGTLTIDGRSFAAGDLISTDYLDKLSGTDTRWDNIDQTGITIYNAVFAGGNVSTGSDKIFAFAKTVFGNSTASVIDAYGRDLVSVGGDGVGGLYGDGNLTYVDGYRELNITNYGTDYFALQHVMDLTDNAQAQAAFEQLTNRQKEFYVTKYKFDGDYDGGGSDASYLMYEKDDVVLSDVYDTFNETQQSHWTAVQSVINEGRYINTIQRCDLCGLKGSRLVLRGAMDRAQDKNEADYINYTINRVGELSLNQNNKTKNVDGWTADDEVHGCYFGIYNVVKFLGALTSDVHFGGSEAAVRQTKSDDYPAVGDKTYYEWKEENQTASYRNNGTSPNKVALASGVFLEIVESLQDDGFTKNYGPITGVIELDLLNVTPGEGGGYVYAKNIHGTPTYTPTAAVTLTAANTGLVTKDAYTYSPVTGTAAMDASYSMQTSGNFIHSLKRIVDDCFPTSKAYIGTSATPAHYWFIQGDFFVYEQLVSAYTGGADAYSTEISIPLTMSAQGNAKLRLLNVLPGLYANPTNMNYDYSDPDNPVSDSLVITYESIEKKFGQNDPISYWDWYMTNKVNREKFVVQTYVCREEVTFNGTTYYPGQGILPSVYNSFVVDGKDATITDESGTYTVKSMFNPTNTVLTDSCYLLTLDMSNPDKWNDYYTLQNSAYPHTNKLTTEGYEAIDDDDIKEGYIPSATFLCNDEGTYGQYYFYEDAVISHTVWQMEQDLGEHTPESQAEFERAYVALADCEVTIGGELKSMMEASPIPQNIYDGLSSSDKAKFDPAYICVSTVIISDGNFRVLNQLISETEYNNYDASPGIQNKFQQAYYCIDEGSWGGKWFEKNQSYGAKDYCQLLPEERSHFTYNYDALDLLNTNYNPYYIYNTEVVDGNTIKTLDPTASYNKLKEYAETGGANINNNIIYFDHPDDRTTNRLYSTYQSMDYDAIYTGTSSFDYVEDGTTTHVTTDTRLSNSQFENLPNERKNYGHFKVSDTHRQDDGSYLTYIVTETFDVSGNMFYAGKQISKSDFDNLGTFQTKVAPVTITAAQYSATTDVNQGRFYYCTEAYTIGDKQSYIPDDYTPHPLTTINNGTYAVGTEVAKGSIITYDEIDTHVPNYQNDFRIEGETPIEEVTLYVPSSASISDLQEDRYVTAIYEYTYTECDAEGIDYDNRVEKHVINIRIKFLSGQPTIGPIKEPELILPLETVGIEVPLVEEGAFPILTGGWQIFATESEAKKHRNGRAFENNLQPLYYYQNDYYIEYYAETRMGRTFSDPVQVHVANYHRLADVINDDNTHMYINHRDNDRDPKIYISNRTTDRNGNPIVYKISDSETKTYANEIDAMQGLWEIVNSDRYGKAGGIRYYGKEVTGAQGLDFYLQSEVAATQSWTPLGDDTNCFQGRFHGNGNTITGLNNSLFGKLCGQVYNTGVMGSFTKGGIANTGSGRIENSWVWSTAAPETGAKAVYNNPGDGAVVLNSYYYYPETETNKLTPHTAGYDINARTVTEFVNGAVAYDLNRYYLEARYRLLAGVNDEVTNHALFRLPDGAMKQTLQAKADPSDEDTYEDEVFSIQYPGTYAWHTYGSAQKGYVEQYYADGDFRYADGYKPTTPDLRYNNGGYIPIYPDDYIFFGQKLTYDIVNNASGDPISHVTHPQAVVKDHTTFNDDVINNSSSGLLANSQNRNENRVYRAPAYFRNGNYGQSVMFNANAAFVDSYTISDGSGTVQPHHDLTAIDFTGGNGDTHGYQGVVAGLSSDFTDTYKPLLDFERLDGIITGGITQNLLVYAPAEGGSHTMSEHTNTTLNNYFREPTYTDYYDDTDPYRIVEEVPSHEVSTIYGHLATQVSTTIGDGNDDYLYTSDADHLLIDRQDFYAPMSYTFAAGNHMWYQRQPDNYANGDEGWEGLSLPFQAELVSTQDKGELSHFYEGSVVGHEYWLRELNKIKDGEEAEATMNYPAGGSATKDYTNTFLWDYYYNHDAERRDKNSELYQDDYYKTSHSFDNYPYSVAGQPYIAGFPGARYYEFDLSGVWTPVHRYADETIASKGPQVITFVSEGGITIEKSTDELQAVEKSGYLFTPSYLNTDVASGNYVLNDEGSGYEQTDAVTTIDAFRPYFVAKSSGAKARRIIFGKPDTSVSDTDKNHRNAADAADDNLVIYAERGKIMVESQLSSAADVRIVTASGIQIAAFTIEPGQTVATPVTSHGVYIVNNRKLLVR